MAELFLDVNVPMYAAGQEHPYRESCAWVMTEIAEGRIAAAMDTEIIQEVLYRYGALRQWRIGVSLTEDLLKIVPTVYPIQLADIRLAVRLFEQYAPKGIPARDVLHVAVMRNNGLSQIISTDTHLDAIREIQRLDPRALFAEAQKTQG
jgi:predicted nucleic acid-binding protein